MKLKSTPLILVFIWCIFMGITVGSIGLGAVFPSLNLIAKPFVCPRGEMSLTTQDYTPTPVETVTTLTWYCVDSQTGEQVELGIFPMVLYAGIIYGLLLFAAVFIGMTIQAKRRASASPPEDDFSRGSFKNDDDDSTNRTSRIERRLVELEKLRNQNLISDEEYKKKRIEILEEL